MASTDACKNCGESFDTSFNYCPNCGQETADNLTFTVLFSNTISNYFSVDARFFKSFIPLMTKPGVLARHFVDGKRLSYLHPAQYYLFVSVVFFFIFSFTVRRADNKLSKALEQSFSKDVMDSLSEKMDSVGLDGKKVLMENQAYADTSKEEIAPVDSVITHKPVIRARTTGFRKKTLDSLIAVGAPQAEKLTALGKKEDAGVFTTRVYAQILKLYEQKAGGILKALYDTIPIAMFFLLPLFALFLKILYWRRGTYAHHMVFSFYFFTFLFTTLSLLLLVNTFIAVPAWVSALVFLSFIVYLMFALRHFYKSRWKGAFFKANFISFLYMSLVLPFALIGVIFVSFLLY